jgi:hypothetical protein
MPVQFASRGISHPTAGGLRTTWIRRRVCSKQRQYLVPFGVLNEHQAFRYERYEEATN